MSTLENARMPRLRDKHLALAEEMAEKLEKKDEVVKVKVLKVKKEK